MVVYTAEFQPLHTLVQISGQFSSHLDLYRGLCDAAFDFFGFYIIRRLAISKVLHRCRQGLKCPTVWRISSTSCISLPKHADKCAFGARIGIYSSGIYISHPYRWGLNWGAVTCPFSRAVSPPASDSISQIPLQI